MKKSKKGKFKLFLLLYVLILSFAGLICGMCIEKINLTIGSGLSFLVWSIYFLCIVDFNIDFK